MPLIPGSAGLVQDQLVENTLADSRADGQIAGLSFFAASMAPSMGQVARDASAEMSAVAVAVAVAIAVPAPVRASWVDKPAESKTLPADIYLVLGSFEKMEQAQEAAGRYGSLSAQVREARVNGRVLHRVVAGPFTPSEARARRDSSGVADAWIARL